METLVTVIHVAVALFMILVVLVQGGNQGGIGAAFGGGNTQGVFGAGGATTFLGKLTYGAAIIFMLTSISLTIMQGTGGEVGLSDKLKQHSQVDKQKESDADEQAPAVDDEAQESDAADSQTAPEPESQEAQPAQEEGASEQSQEAQ